MHVRYNLSKVAGQTGSVPWGFTWPSRPPFPECSSVALAERARSQQKGLGALDEPECQLYVYVISDVYAKQT